MVLEAINKALSGRPDAAAVILCAALGLLGAMNDSAAPSVSLEGKSVWLPQSLPIALKSALRAKTAMQLILNGIPLLFTVVCAVAIVDAAPAVKLLTIVMPLLYSVFYAVLCTVIGVKMPVMTWSNEVTPIKQSGGVAIALFGGWAICAVIGVGYLAVGWRLGAAGYLLAWSVVLAALTLLMQRWLDTKGAAAFAAL